MQCGSEVSDHFGAWMTLLGAAIALVTALATVALSSYFEGRREAARRAHSDQVEATKRAHERDVRFHDERLKAYIEYMSATSTLFAAASYWITGRPTPKLTDFLSNYLAAYTKSFSRVTMLVKSPLRRHLKVLHDYVELLTRDQSPEVVERVAHEAIGARADFERAAKEELGID
jgi:hypothetical protein